MKTLYLKFIGKIFLILLICSVVQAAHAKKLAGHFKKLTFVRVDFSKADTPKTAKPVSAVKKETAKRPEDGVDENILARDRQEFKRLRDPALNRVPVERLLIAKKVKDQNIAQQAAALKGVNPPLSPLNSIQWHERGPGNVGGRTRALIFDLNDVPNGYKKVFAGGVGGGLWYTSDITATPVLWHKINDFFENIAISCIVQDPINHNILYAGTGEGFENGDAIQGLGVWKSTDDGVTWAQLASTTNFTYVNSILVDRNEHVYIVGIGYGVAQSTDFGATFNQVISSPIYGGDLQLAANGDIYASFGLYGANGSVFISDFGVHGANTGNVGNWTNITPNPTGVITPASTDWWRIKLACAPGSSNIVYGFFEGQNNLNLTSVQQYNKTTNTWTVKHVPTGTPFSNGQAWYSIAAAVDPNNSNVLYAGSLDGSVSKDGGVTWNTITQWYVGEVAGLNANQYVHADDHAYTFSPGSSTRLAIGCDGGVFFTSTANAAHPAFLMQDNTYDVTQFYAVALHPTLTNYALAGAQDNGTQQFTSAGISNTTEATGGDGAFCFIDQLNGNYQTTAYVYSNYYLSTDNGANFNTLLSSNDGQFINPTDYDSKNKNLYGGSIAGDYLRITNLTGAPANAEIAVTNFNGANVSSVNVSPVTANKVYFGLDNGTVVAVNNANTGTSPTSTLLTPNASSSSSVSCVAVDPASENHLLVSYFNYGVPHIYETKNALAGTPTWTLIDGTLPDLPVRWVMFVPGDVTKAIIATELGVWTTDLINGTSTAWNATNSGLANVRTDMLKYRASDRTLAAATHGRGLFTTTLPSTSNAATLSALKLSTGFLSPAFASGTTSYTASVIYGASTITVTPTATSGSSTIKVNGVTVASGTASGPIALNVGPNTITTVVTNGASTDTYTVTVTRAKSYIATLKALKLSYGALTPVFGATTTSYTATAIYGVTSITVTPTASDVNATIKVNGTTVASGTASGPITLNVGANPITIVVTAQDGTTTKTYTVTDTRAGSYIATLSNLKLSAGALSPAFGAGTTSYTATETNATSSITVTPTAVESHATIKVNGATVASGVASGAIALAVGPNTVTTVVTAQDGHTTKTYTVTVTRMGPINIPDETASVSSPENRPRLNGDTVIVHQGVSPNGDGINDFLQIDNIANYPDNKLTIINRNGALIYEAKGYDNSTRVFDGHSNKNGQMQLPGTYFFSLDYTANGIIKHRTGYLVLKY